MIWGIGGIRLTEKTLEYCMRGIIRYLNGEVDLFEKYINKAMKMEKNLCQCGGQIIKGRYDRKRAKICFDCGRVWQQGKIVRKCLVNSRRVS